MENDSSKTWRCNICETYNNGNVCVVCGSKRPEAVNIAERFAGADEEWDKPANTKRTEWGTPPYDSLSENKDTHKHTGKEYKRRSSRLTLILFIILLIVCVCVGGMLFSNYNLIKARSAMDKGDYVSASKLLEDISGSKAAEMRNSCDYNIGMEKYNNGEEEEAMEYFEKLGNYRDSEKMLKNCAYAVVQNNIDEGRYLSAYELILTLGSEEENKDTIESLKKNIYSQGIDYLEKESYETAKLYFNKIAGYSDSDAYYDICSIASENNRENYTELEKYIDFPQVKKILLTNTYFDKFMLGNWACTRGYYIDFISNGSGTTCSFSMPVNVDGEYWKHDDGVYYSGSGSSWTPYWSYSIIDSNTVDITMKKTGLTYRFYRE